MYVLISLFLYVFRYVFISVFMICLTNMFAMSYIIRVFIYVFSYVFRSFCLMLHHVLVSIVRYFFSSCVLALFRY